MELRMVELRGFWCGNDGFLVWNSCFELRRAHFLPQERELYLVLVQTIRFRNSRRKIKVWFVLKVIFTKI